jgi:hypothetical protein
VSCRGAASSDSTRSAPRIAEDSEIDPSLVLSVFRRAEDSEIGPSLLLSAFRRAEDSEIGPSLLLSAFRSDGCPEGGRTAVVALTDRLISRTGPDPLSS